MPCYDCVADVIILVCIHLSMVALMSRCVCSSPLSLFILHSSFLFHCMVIHTLRSPHRGFSWKSHLIGFISINRLHQIVGTCLIDTSSSLIPLSKTSCPKTLATFLSIDSLSVILLYRSMTCMMRMKMLMTEERATKEEVKSICYHIAKSMYLVCLISL